jgi:hypothetical protein
LYIELANWNSRPLELEEPVAIPQLDDPVLILRNQRQPYFSFQFFTEFVLENGTIFCCGRWTVRRPVKKLSLLESPILSMPRVAPVVARARCVWTGLESESSPAARSRLIKHPRRSANSPVQRAGVN